MNKAPTGDRIKQPILHPEWMPDALESLKQSIRLHQDGLVPKSIGAWMLIVPMMRVMRCVFGTDRATLAAMQRDIERNEALTKWADDHLAAFPAGCPDTGCGLCVALPGQPDSDSAKAGGKQ